MMRRAAGNGRPSTAADEARLAVRFHDRFGREDEAFGPGRWVESARVKDAAEREGPRERALRAARGALGLEVFEG